MVVPTGFTLRVAAVGLDALTYDPMQGNFGRAIGENRRGFEAHHVLIFEVGQAPCHRAVATAFVLLGRILDTLINPLCDSLSIFDLWVGLVIGRHVFVLDHDEDAFPGLHLLVAAAESFDVMKSQLALGFFRPVAAEAVFFE